MLYPFTAGLNSDYRMLSTPIMSSIGESTVSGSIIITDDDTNEDTEMFTIHIDNCTNNLAPCVPGMMNLTIITIDDNDGNVTYIYNYILLPFISAMYK